jgi:hypothetical protein
MKIVLAIIGAALLLGSVWAFRAWVLPGHDTMPGRDGRAIGIILLAIFVAGSVWATPRADDEPPRPLTLPPSSPIQIEGTPRGKVTGTISRQSSLMGMLWRKHR